MNYALRDATLENYCSETEVGGIRRFGGLPLVVLQALIDQHFVDLSEWNNCPGVADMFLPFLKRNPQFTAHGYVVLSSRDDTGVTVEGVEKSGHLTKAEIIDFANTFHRADEIHLTTDYARCWYD
jgi:hypothetical protein